MTIIEFFESCMSVFPRSSDNTEYFDYLDDDTSILTSNNAAIFNSECEMVESLSSCIANKIYESDDFLKDNLQVPYGEEEIFWMMRDHDFWLSPHYISVVTLMDIGIERILIKDGGSFLFVNYSSLPDYYRMIIDSFLFEKCSEKIIDYLSKLSPYKILKEKKEEILGCLLVDRDTFAYINTMPHIRMYIDRFEWRKKYVLGDLLNCEIEIPAKFVKIDFGNIPQYVEVDVILEKTWCTPEYINEIDGYYVPDRIRFQIIQNPNKSLILKPMPLDIERVILRQIGLWNDTIYNHKDYCFLPSPFKQIVDYIQINNIRTLYGYIEKILNKEEAYNIARIMEKEEFDNCFVGMVQICKIPNSRWVDLASSDMIMVKMKKTLL